MDTAGISGDWFAVPGDGQAEAVDISAVTGNPGQAGVLIAQLTLVPCQPSSGNGAARPAYDGAVTLYTAASDGGTFGGLEVEARFPGCPAVSPIFLRCCRAGDRVRAAVATPTVTARSTSGISWL
jgi:hypothetical protein